MGEIIEFPSNGETGQGYLALPPSGTGPGVVVIQEWWGLVPHIEHLCDRMAEEGFVALAPDLYHGEVAREPDEAGKLMMALQLDHAAKDLSGALREVATRVIDDKVGVIGFCMGGGLALYIAAKQPSLVGAVVPFYGVIPWTDGQPNYASIAAPVLGHYAEHDHSVTPQGAMEIGDEIRSGGNNDVTIHVYPDTDHAFVNDDRPEVYKEEAATLAWDRTVDFLKSRLS